MNINFKKCATLLGIYHRKQEINHSQEDCALIQEAISKLKLLHIIMRQLKTDEKKKRENTQKNLPILLTSTVLPENFFITIYIQRIEIYTYSFYYLAFRVYDILRTVTKLWIHARGIVIVRNHLMEHPEGRASKILSNGFGHIGPLGPVVKPGRSQNEKQIHMDKGLYFNAKEFETNLMENLGN